MRRFFSGLLALLGALSHPVLATEPNYDFSPVTRLVQHWVDAGYYPGAAVLVAGNGQVIYQQCFGNYTPETPVFIASAGKWLAAATIMSVVDEGKLSLDDHPSKWLPEFKNDAKDRATLRQLLSHTSGYPPYQPKDQPVDNYQTLAESVAHLLPLPPHYPPGAQFEYGGLAMQVAGRMAEVATGRDWETLFQERIAQPCGMTNTHFTPVDSGGGHSPMLGGGARSTLHDYANFLSMIFNDGVFGGKRVLSPNAIHEMQADQVRGAVVKPGEFVQRVRGFTHNGIYGLGEWREQLDADGQAVLISSPGWAGAYPWIDKTIGVYGVILAHVNGPNVGRDHFSGFYSSPVLAQMVRDVVAGVPESTATRHPEILAPPADRDEIKAKLEQTPWARESYAALKARIDPLIERCQTNEQFMSSRLFMNWQTHFATPLVVNSRSAGGEGFAPVPTPRFGGARDWATKYQPPAKLEDLKPYNDNHGKVWLFNKETQKEEWADPGLTGRMFETVNERIFQSAADAGFVYWMTGDEKYARYASEILWTYMEGFSYMHPPKIITGGGQQIIGFDSFEVIHEDIVTPIAETYDFIYDYLRRQGRDTGMIQAGLKRMADRVINGGGATGNWNLNQARIIAYAGLALEDNTNYPDGKGREYYVDVVLNARLPAQTGLTRVIQEGFDPVTGVWPEAPGYSFGTAKDIILIASLCNGDEAGRAVLDNPILERALRAQINLVYPNGYAVGLGDTVNPRVNTVAMELLIAEARHKGNTNLETFLTAALNREITTGYYHRNDNANLVALTKYVGDLMPIPAAAPNPQRTFFGTPLNVLMQRINGADPAHSLGAALYGTKGGHIHANGLAMELYGAGLILGADPGRGVSYWQPEHAEYYSQPPAHNTVIVDGRSDYPINPGGQIAMKLDCLEPASGKTGMSPDIGFVQVSFHYRNPLADQQRTLALVQISPTAGFYFDVFRSRAENVTNSFHDYLYHNIGQSLVLTGEEGQPLPLAPSHWLGSKHGCLKGYDYFRDEKSAEISGGFSGVFSTRLADGSLHAMRMWMPGQIERRVFSVSAPADHAGRDELPSFAETPMPTMIVRQPGDAWRKPFVAIYEPTLGSENAITSVRLAKLDKADADLAACVIEAAAADGTGGENYSALLAQDDQPENETCFEGAHFCGSFGAIIKRGGNISELYLGHGSSIGAADVFLAATDKAAEDAVLMRDGIGWIYSSSSPCQAGLVFPLQAGERAVKSWQLARTDADGRQEIIPAKIQRIRDRRVLTVTASLPAGERIGLSVEPVKP